MSKSKKSHTTLRKKQAKKRRKLAKERCSRKTQYYSSKDANIEADKITRRTGIAMRPY